MMSPLPKGKRAHGCLRIMRSLFSVVIDPLVARPLFLGVNCCLRENSRWELIFSRLFFGRSDRVLRSTVREGCRSATKPARNPKKVCPFARYGPYDFGGLRSFMVDPSC